MGDSGSSSKVVTSRASCGKTGPHDRRDLRAGAEHRPLRGARRDHLRLVDDGGRRGVEILAADAGPGIPDVALAMQDGFSTSSSLGLGLPGVRRLMDEFEISSEFGKGTTVMTPGASTSMLDGG